MRAGGAPGVAGQRDHLPAADGLVGVDAETGEVAVERLGVVAVIHDDGLPILGMRTREHHHAGSGSVHLGAHGGTDVEPTVELRLRGPGREAAAEARVHGTTHRPARGERGEHAGGAGEEALEGAQVVTFLLHHSGETVQIVADGRAIRRLAGARGARAASDTRGALGGTVLGTEGLPDPGAELAPAV